VNFARLWWLSHGRAPGTSVRGVHSMMSTPKLEDQPAGVLKNSWQRARWLLRQRDPALSNALDIGMAAEPEQHLLAGSAVPPPST
jgi:hypothetical protein